MLSVKSLSVWFQRVQFLRPMQTDATSANKCQNCCVSMQTDAACLAQQCCVRLHGPLAQQCWELLALVDTCCVVHQHCWRLSEDAMHSGTIILKKKIAMRMHRCFHEANIVVVPCKRAQQCCATLRRLQNNRNVRTCCTKSLTHYNTITSANKCPRCCGSLQTDATCWAQQCCLLLANNVASICMGF